MIALEVIAVVFVSTVALIIESAYERQIATSSLDDSLLQLSHVRASLGRGHRRIVLCESLAIAQKAKRNTVNRLTAVRAKLVLDDETWVVDLVALPPNIEVIYLSYEGDQPVVPDLSCDLPTRDISNQVDTYLLPHQSPTLNGLEPSTSRASFVAAASFASISRNASTASAERPLSA